MTLSFKDPNGDEWGLLAWSRSDDRRHPATAADLLTALGQLSPGSDGPTREDIQSAYDAAYLASEQAGERYPHDDAKRSLYNAGRAEGLALGEQKQAARVRELEQRVADLKFALGDGAGWFDRYKRAESELAATKAKLAEVTDNHAVIVNERDLFARQSAHFEGLYLNATAKLEEVERERDEEIETRCRANLAWQEKHDELSRECGKLRSELASARRVVEAAKAWQSFDEVPEHERIAEFSDAETALSREVRALASASNANTTGSSAPRSAADFALPAAGSPTSAQSLAGQAGHGDAQQAPGGTVGNGVDVSPGADGALASAGADADRTEAPKSLREQAREKLAAMSDSQVSNLWVRLQHLEPEPPRPEAGESGHDPHHDPECASCGHVASDHRPGSCGACCEDEESGDSAKCDCRRFREEEPKTEPQPSGVVMVGLRIDGPYADVSLWPLVDKSRVETMAYATSEEWAKRIAECCNRALRPELREGPAAPHGDRHEGD